MKHLQFLFLIGFFFLQSCSKDESTPQTGVFELKSPTNGQMGVSLTPTFTWSKSTAADTYSLVVAENSLFTDPIVNVSDLKDTTYSVSSPLPIFKRYYWKVTSTNSAGTQTAINAGTSFKTLAPTPAASPDVSKYYVSPQGKDSPENGTVASPWKTLAYAAAMVPPSENDIIFLNEGTYNETEPALIPLGVNVEGANELTTILSSTGVMISAGIDSTASNYKEYYEGSLIQLVSLDDAILNGNQTLSKFTIDGKSKSLKVGVWVQTRNNVTMHDVTIKNCHLRGAVFANKSGSSINWMKGVEVHDCEITNSGRDLPDKSETLGNLCIGGNIEDSEIYNITIKDNEGYGIKFIFNGGYKNVKIHDCNITLNEFDDKWGEDASLELWNVGPGTELYNINCNTWISIANILFQNPTGTENLKIHNIRMIDKDGGSSKESIELFAQGVEVYDSYFQNKGFGMAIWESGGKNISIHNNIFYNSQVQTSWASGAIYIDNSVGNKYENINVYNNVFDTYNNAFTIKTSHTGSKVTGVNIKNNAFLNIVGNDFVSIGDNISNIVFDNNLKYNSIEKPWSLEGSGITSQLNNISGDPEFSKTGDRWDTYYKPASGSFVIDKGVDVDFPFSGSAPDIGRFEFE